MRWTAGHNKEHLTSPVKGLSPLELLLVKAWCVDCRLTAALSAQGSQSEQLGASHVMVVTSSEGSAHSLVDLHFLCGYPGHLFLHGR